MAQTKRRDTIGGKKGQSKNASIEETIEHGNHAYLESLKAERFSFDGIVGSAIVNGGVLPPDGAVVLCPEFNRLMSPDIPDVLFPHATGDSTTWPTHLHSLSDAEVSKNYIQNVFNVHATGNGAQMTQSKAQIFRR